MNFYHDIVDKTSKLFHNLDGDFSLSPVVQITSHTLNSFVLASDTFFCDLYATPDWINECKLGNNKVKVFDHFEATGVTCDYIWFNLLNSSQGNNTFNQCRPLMCVVIATNDFLNDAGLLANLKFNSGHYFFIIIFNYGLSDVQLRELKFDCVGKALIPPVNEVSKSAIMDVFENNIFSKDRLRDIQTLSLLRFFRPRILEISHGIIKSKAGLDSLSRQKDLLNEKIRKIENDRLTIDLISKIKSDVQNKLRILDRVIKKKYAKLLLQKTGEFSVLTDNIVGCLDNLDKKDIPGRIPRYETRIPKKILADIEITISNELQKNYQTDQINIFLEINELQESINTSASIAESTANKLSVDLASFPDISSNIQSTVNINKMYRGELPKMTFQAYLMQIRQQTFFVFMLVTFVSPVFQGLTFIFSEPATKQYVMAFAQAISVFAGLISLGLAIYYSIDLKKKVPEIEAELFLKELDKAKEQIQGDARRIFIEATREWINGVNAWLNETAESFNTQLDKLAGEQNNQKRQEVKRNEAIFQRVLIDYNNKKANMDNTERLFSSLMLELQNNTNTLESKMNQYINIK